MTWFLRTTGLLLALGLFVPAAMADPEPDRNRGGRNRPAAERAQPSRAAQPSAPPRAAPQRSAPSRPALVDRGSARGQGAPRAAPAPRAQPAPQFRPEARWERQAPGAGLRTGRPPQQPQVVAPTPRRTPQQWTQPAPGPRAPEVFRTPTPTTRGEQGIRPAQPGRIQPGLQPTPRDGSAGSAEARARALEQLRGRARQSQGFGPAPTVRQRPDLGAAPRGAPIQDGSQEGRRDGSGLRQGTRTSPGEDTQRTPGVRGPRGDTASSERLLPGRTARGTRTSGGALGFPATTADAPQTGVTRQGRVRGATRTGSTALQGSTATGTSSALTLGPRAGVRYSRHRHFDSAHHHHDHARSWWSHRRTFGWSFHFGYVSPWWYGGHYVSYWHPWYYHNYVDFWIGGLPPFGFRTVYYTPAYDPVIQTIVIERPVIIQQPGAVMAPEPYVEPLPQEAAPGEFPPPSPAPGEDAAPGEAPGRAEFEAGFNAFLAGRNAEAVSAFRAALAADPENGEAWLGMTHAGFALGDYALASEAIGQAAAMGGFPRGYRFDPRPLYDRRAEGSFDRARERLHAWVGQHPEDADALLVAAWLHVSLGERREASDAVHRVLSLRPDDETAPLLTIAMLPPAPPSAEEAEGAGRPPGPAAGR